MEEDQTNLVALVALLISTAGFKEELSQIRLGGTSFTLLTIFIIASIAFGILLYVHLIINAYLMLSRSLRETKKLFFTIFMRILFMAALIIIPLGGTTIASLNWMGRTYCTNEVVEDTPFGSFPPSGRMTSNEICRTQFAGKFLPIFVVSVAVLTMLTFVISAERKYKDLPPELRTIMLQINELRMFQAVSSDENKIRDIDKLITRLTSEYKQKKKKLIKKTI